MGIWYKDWGQYGISSIVYSPHIIITLIVNQVSVNRIVINELKRIIHESDVSLVWSQYVVDPEQ